jgi:hypothetical protein
MSDAERRFFVEKCGKLLQDVLVEIRALGWGGRSEQVAELADLTHNVPEFLAGRADHVLGYLRAGFVAYARKYHPGTDPEASRYVALLDMDEATFHDLYRPAGWPEPTPVG